MQLNRLIDHTKLGPKTSMSDIDKLISEARQYKFKSVCIDPIWVNYVKHNLKDSEVKICTVVGFPSGAHTIEVKDFEAKQAIIDGADEIDYVLNISQAKAGNWSYISREMASLRNTCKGKVLKVILEICYLTNEEITQIGSLAVSNGLDFIKTSTGFGTGGATEEAVALMVSITKSSKTEVKASGGIRNYETAERFAKIGATRLGTSQSIDIVNQSKGTSDGNY
jgi:deoxyribose-phosphate aldolase